MDAHKSISAPKDELQVPRGAVSIHTPHTHQAQLWYHFLTSILSLTGEQAGKHQGSAKEANSPGSPDNVGPARQGLGVPVFVCAFQLHGNPTGNRRPFSYWGKLKCFLEKKI